MSFLDRVANKKDNEFFHSWYLFIVSGLTLLFLLISSNPALDLFLTSVTLFLFFKNKLSPQSLFKLILYSLSFSFMFFLLNLLYTNEANQTGTIYKFSFLHFYFSFFEGAVDNALKIFSRLFMMTLISMGSTYVINYSKLILYLIVHKGLKVFWGYPILIALNSILLLKEEFDRISMSAKFRGLSFWERIFVFFPLLVFAIRHSQRGSLSLVTRGLSPHKSFYFTYALRERDKVIMLCYFFIYACLVAIMFYFR